MTAATWLLASGLASLRRLGLALAVVGIGVLGVTTSGASGSVGPTVLVPAVQVQTAPDGPAP
jgi:hypothetical protein